jgi:hypothetical protein
MMEERKTELKAILIGGFIVIGFAVSFLAGLLIGIWI